jgi:hypothetical protein
MSYAATLVRAVRRAAALTCSVWLAGCASVHHYAAGQLSDALAGSRSSFASDDDPELIRAAAPFGLKFMESALLETPEHVGLLTATAAGFTQFSYGFVQQDADEAEGHDVAAAFALRLRARGLYLRARDYGLRAIEARHAGFTAALRSSPATAVAQLGRADEAAMYWTALAWAASISLAKDSPEALAELPRVDAVVRGLQALAPDFDQGGFDSFLISYSMGRPGAVNAAQDARAHFDRAVRLSGGQKASPYVALAETVCVAAQDRREFAAKLQQALAIDPAAQPQWRLENLIMQHRARWLLGHADALFLE